MTNRQITDKPGRPTIGLLTHTTADIGGYIQTLIGGVVSFAEQKDANLICFAGGYLFPHGSIIPRDQSNVLYDLVSPARVDGVVCIASLGHAIGQEGLAALCERYRPLPMACAGGILRGFPSVDIDNAAGMRSLLVHFVEDHGYRRIAFIRGHQEALDAAERYRAYTEVLAEYDIPLDPALVVQGNYSHISGEQAMIELLDDRNVEFDALVAANDEMAIAALDVLQGRGIRVPGDVALAGFDDLLEGRFAMPPLTTVVQPVHTIGWQAAELVWSQMHDDDVPEQIILPTELVIRQSCGCPSHMAQQAVIGSIVAANGPPFQPAEATLAAHRKNILSEMLQASGISSGDPVSSLIVQLLDRFISEISLTAPSGAFLEALGDLLHQSKAVGRDANIWQGTISALRRGSVPCLATDNQVLSRAEDLWHQARVVIGEAAGRVQSHQLLQVQQEIELQRQIGQALISTFDIDKLMDALAAGLTGLEIPSTYLSLYEDPQTYENHQSAPEWSRLVLACGETTPLRARPAELVRGGLRFPSRQLVPEGMLPCDQRYTFVVEALHFKTAQIGFCLFEMRSWKLRPGENVYDTLRGQIASAIQGSRFLEARRQAETALEQQARELERSNADLEQFAYIASHDLQEPLRMVSSYLQLIERRYKDQLDQDADEFIAFAVDGATRMHTLIRDLLAYSRVDRRGKPFEATDCAAILESALANLKVAIEESSAIVTHDPLPTVMADDIQLSQIFQNLIGNAIKFHKTGIQPVVHIGAVRRDTVWEFSVRDNGIGIDPQHFQRIFMIFQRLHSRQEYPGTGIGLAVCKKIVERHGGRIRVESEPGSGTTFFFTLPAIV